MPIKSPEARERANARRREKHAQDAEYRARRNAANRERSKVRRAARKAAGLPANEPGMDHAGRWRRWNEKVKSTDPDRYAELLRRRAELDRKRKRDKVQRAAAWRRWKKSHPDEVAARAALHRAAHRDEIAAISRICRNTGLSATLIPKEVRDAVVIQVKLRRLMRTTLDPSPKTK